MITVEFVDFKDMVSFAESLLGQISNTNKPAPMGFEAAGVEAAAPAEAPEAVPAAVPTARAVPVTAPAAAVPVTAGPMAAPAAVPVSTPGSIPESQMVPTASAEYTLDDLARAGMTLMDLGKQDELQKLLQTFGVPALPALPKEQYGTFATALRGLGARI